MRNRIISGRRFGTRLWRPSSKAEAFNWGLGGDPRRAGHRCTAYMCPGGIAGATGTLSTTPRDSSFAFYYTTFNMVLLQLIHSKHLYCMDRKSFSEINMHDVR